MSGTSGENSITGENYTPRTLMPEGIYDFPTLRIVSINDPFTQHRTYWHGGFALVSGASEEYNFGPTAVSLRGRGNSTWYHGEEKRPLRLRFNHPRPMLDSGHAATDWILLANLFDMSLLRNYAALYLAAGLENLDFTPFTRFVHLYVNDEYMGVYQLTDERDVIPGRMPLNFRDDAAESDHFFRMDAHVAGNVRRREGAVNIEGIDYFRAVDRIFEPRGVPRRNREAHTEYMRQFVIRVYEVAHRRNFEEISAIIDLPSFVDFYIVNEFLKNIDIGANSVFMSIRSADNVYDPSTYEPTDDALHRSARRLHFGPVWDFDRSAGNTIYWYEPENIFATEKNPLFYELLAVPEIFEMIAARWQEIRHEQIHELLTHLEYLAHNYAAAFERNFVPHPHIFCPDYEPAWFRMVPPVKRDIHSFAEQAEYLLWWLHSRAAWLDEYFVV